MSIDIDWSKAPEGCTHCNAHQVGAKWWQEDGQIMREYANGKWRERLYWPKNLIPRPKAPEAEWVDGLPPVGCEIEYNFGMFQCPDAPIKRAKFIGPDHDNLVIKFLGEHEGSRFTSTSPSCVRPIRTKGQRQRDEFKQWFMDNRWNDTEAAIDDFLSRYNLEPKP